VKIVTLYNHKGGVSKTTSTFNLATFLADTGSRVLMVDADPQCNLTEIALARRIEELDAEAAKSADADQVPDLPGTNVLDAINQRIKGDAAFIDIDKVELVEVKQDLLLLRGSVDLSSIEDDLAEAHVQRMAMRTNLMRTYVAVGDFLVRLAKKHRCDYVFIDVGPSSGALTRAFFLTCDAFFLPAAPDRFNVQAIGTLSRIIDRWIAEHKAIRELYRGLDLPIRVGTPAFLGVVIQAFKLYAGRPKPGYKLWMSRIPKEISTRLKPVMVKHTEDTKLYLPTSSRPIAVEIPDFNQLAPLMQEVGKAVFNITQADTARITESGKPWVGNNWTQAEQRMSDYRTRIEKLGKLLRALS
jgi:chromosome partitioning protein